jgi:hypothetical protein
MSLTRVADTLYCPNGATSPVDQLFISCPAFITAANRLVLSTTINIFANPQGTFIVDLEPSVQANANPAFSYTINYLLKDGTRQSDLWNIPISGAVQKVTDVRVIVGVSSSSIVPISQLSPIGASAGQYVRFNGTIWAAISGPPVLPLSSPLTTVTFSPTPVFDLSLGNGFQITLTGNVTSSSIINLSTGLYSFLIIQDATGGRPFVWPGNVYGAPLVGSTANKRTTVLFYCDGTSLYGLGLVNL